MDIKFVDLKKNYLNIKDEIHNKFNSLFDNCDFINGKSVREFEEHFANYLNIKHFIGCANGTDALEIAVNVLDLNENDEIIVQGNTYIATCLGPLNNNIKLVLCDIEQDTQMIDLEKLERKITEKTKAVIVVHLYGLMPDMDKVMNICEKYNLILIEDCAQAHGAEWKGKKAGTFGQLSCFSFYPGKNLGAYGDAGGIATNSDDFNEKMRMYINIGCKIKYEHELIGRNSRIDTLQASFLDVKLNYLDTWNNIRRQEAKIYSNNLKNIGDIQLPVVIDGCTPVFHLYVIRTKYRDELKKYMDSKGVPCLIHYPISIAETKAMKKYNFDLDDVKNCILNSKEILSLPMHPDLEIHEINYICDNIKKFFMEKNLLKIKDIETTSKDGILHCVNNIIFDTQRFFYIDSFKNNNFVRGLHANINFNELMIIINGTVNIKLIDQHKIEETRVLNKGDIFYISQMKWIEFEALSEDTVIFCLTDKNINDSISIHNFDDFINYKI
jgi:dTDP-4-amino-4,6-dideoxygalactose transaminase